MQRTGAAEIRAGVEKAEAGVTELCKKRTVNQDEKNGDGNRSAGGNRRDNDHHCMSAG